MLGLLAKRCMRTLQDVSTIIYNITLAVVFNFLSHVVSLLPLLLFFLWWC